MISGRKKKILRRRILLFAIPLFIAAAALLVYKIWINSKIKFVRYIEFGIPIPEEYSIHGIDVSKFQGQIEWHEVQAMNVNNIHLGFVFIKATEGIDDADPQFQRNWKKAKSAGMICGAYHYFIPTKDGKMQAESFIHEAELSSGDLPPVLDIEQSNGLADSVLKKEIMKWLTTTEEYYHVRPIIYTNIEFYNRHLGKDFDVYPLWVAHYYQEHKPNIHRDWSFWQHSDEGHVSGIMHKVDFNVYAGDSLAFRNLLLH